MMKNMKSVKMSDRYYFLVIFFISGCIANQTDEIKVNIYPDELAIQPGSNISIKCNTTDKISRFYWNMPGKIEKIDEHTMLLHLNNVGMDKSYRFTPSTDIICTNDFQSAGCTVDVGYNPVAPHVECLMQNLYNMHCRWTYFDKRTKDRPDWQHENTYTAMYETTGISPTWRGKCKSAYPYSSNSHGSCNVMEEDEQNLRYWKNIKINLTVTNIMGMNSTLLHFTPIKNVMLSPPTIYTTSLSSGNEGEAQSIEASLSTCPETHQYLQRHCFECYKLQIHYKEISDDFDEKTIRHYKEKTFWDHWSQFIPYEDDLNRNLMNDSRIKIINSKTLILNHLSANTRYILQAKWKVEYGDLISGVWSISTYVVIKTNILKPPAFSETSLLFYSNNSCSSLQCNFPDDIETTSHQLQCILLWKHSEQSNKIHRKNIYLYQSSILNHNIPKSSRNLSLLIDPTMNNSGIRILAFNKVGSTTSPTFKISSGDSCVLEVISFDLESTNNDLLTFRVTWIYFSSNSSMICNIKDIKDTLKVNLFAWREKNLKVKKFFNRFGTLPSDIKLNLFFIKIDNKNKSGINEERVIEFQVQDVKTSTVNVSSYFQSHTAYRIAVSMSSSIDTKVLQGPANLNENLFYYSVQKPSGTPTSVICTEVSQNSMIVTWKSVTPVARHGPILGYEIYYTTNKNCFSGHQSVSCHGPYEKCNKSHVHVEKIMVDRNTAETHKISDTNGWNVEYTNTNSLSILLENLQPGSHYYIGVAAFNKNGTSKCFHHIIQDTAKAGYLKSILLPLIIFIFIILIIFALYQSRKNARLCFHRPMAAAEEVFRIPLNADRDENDTTVSTMLPGESCDYTDASENHIDEVAHTKAQMVMEEHQNTNNNATDKLLHHHGCNELEKNCIHANGMPLYLHTTPPRNESNLTNQDTNSLSSDVPGCSQSSTTASTSRQSTSCCDDSDESSIEEDIYTSIERALIISGRTRCCVRI